MLSSIIIAICFLLIGFYIGFYRYADKYLFKIWEYKQKKFSSYEEYANKLYIQQKPYINDLINYFNYLDKKNLILLAGDSITQGFKNDIFFKSKNTYNTGVNGSSSYIFNKWVDKILNKNIKTMLIAYGLNDLYLGSDIKNIINEYKILIKKINTINPNTIIIIRAVLPSNLVSYNKILKLNSALKELSNTYGGGK